MNKMFILMGISAVLLILSFTFVKSIPSTYDVKLFLNRNFNAHYRLDTYPEFFDGDTNAFESAQAFNGGEINYQQYAIQRGNRIVTKPIEWIDNPSRIMHGSGGMGGPEKIVKGSMDHIGLIAGGGGGGYMPEDCTMEWFTADEDGNMISGPGGCY